MVTILVFGIKGMLGKYVYNHLYQYYNTIGITRKNIDVFESYKKNTLIDDIRNIIKTNDPQYIINCFGIINKRPDISVFEMFVVNSYFPRVLLYICNQKNIKLIHPSTDCVFSGKIGNYDTISLPDPYDDYGVSKSLADNIDACIIRASIIGFDDSKRSLLDWVIANEHNTINGYTNHYWNGITCLEYAKIIRDIIEGKIEYWTGIKHIGCKNNVSKYDLIISFKNIFNIKVNIVPKETDKICNRTLKLDIIRDTIESQLKELKDMK